MKVELVESIYRSISNRFRHIEHSALRDVLLGKTKPHTINADITRGIDMPSIEEAESAFLRYSCVIITAFRGGYTLDENLARNQLLKKDVESHNYSIRPVNGCYKEADREYVNIEKSFFVCNNRTTQSDFQFFSVMYDISAKYEQDSFLFKQDGLHRTAFLIATNKNGRIDFRGETQFAGQLYLHVPDKNAWTDCSDGRFAFQLKGMIIVPTANPRIQIGEGNLFDTESYSPNGLIALFNSKQHHLKDSCSAYDNSKIPLFKHRYNTESQTPTSVQNAVLSALNDAKKAKCTSFGFHCSAQIDGSYIKGAEIALITLKEWIERNRSIKKITIVDTYGDFGKVINTNK